MATAAGSSRIWVRLRQSVNHILLCFIWFLIPSSFPSQQFFLLSVFCRFSSLFLSLPLTCFLICLLLPSCFIPQTFLFSFQTISSLTSSFLLLLPASSLRFFVSLVSWQTWRCLSTQLNIPGAEPDPAGSSRAPGPSLPPWPPAALSDKSPGRCSNTSVISGVLSDLEQKQVTEPEPQTAEAAFISTFDLQTNRILTFLLRNKKFQDVLKV